MAIPRLYLLPALLLISLTACTGETEGPTAEKVDISLHTAMVIDGGDGMDNGEPFLGRVSGVITDTDGNNYVYDGQSHSFITYDAEGNYLASFGREGSGPGEIQSVYTMFADSRDRLIVADGGNSRITIFDRDGNFLLNQPQHGIQAIRDISELEDGRFLLSGWHPEREGMIHIVDSDFSEIEASLAGPEVIGDEEDASLDLSIRTMAGSAEMLDDGRILFAPRAYAGRLYLFEEEGESWSVADTVSGWSTIEKPLRSSNGSTSIMDDYPSYSISSIMFNEDGMTITHLISESHGLYRTNEGSFIHLTSHFSEEDKSYNMVLERFDPETLTLGRYGTVPLKMSNSTRTHWVGREGSLYRTHSDSVGFWKVNVEGF